MRILKSIPNWLVVGIFVIGFMLSCSTGPDYKRDSEYDTGSNSYRLPGPRGINISITQDQLFRLDWNSVKDSDGYFVGKYIYGKDTTTYEQFAVFGENATSFTDSAGISLQQYSYTVTTFIYDGDNKRRGRDSLVRYVDVEVGEIESFEYQKADESNSLGQNSLLFTIKTNPAINHDSYGRYEYKLVSDVVIEYKADEMKSFVVLDTLERTVNSTIKTIAYPDTLKRIVKKFRAKPILRSKNIQHEGPFTSELTRTVQNPYRIDLKRLDEMRVEYTISVGENRQSEASIFEGVYVYLNGTPVDTLKGDFPQTTTLSTKGYSENVEVGIGAFVNESLSNIRSKLIQVYSLTNPIITEIEGNFSNSHTIRWTHQKGRNMPDVNSFIIERRINETDVFKEIAVVDPEINEYKSTNLSGNTYEYRVRTPTSDPGYGFKTRYTNSYDVIQTAEHPKGLEEYHIISNSMIYRLSVSGSYVYDVYYYQNVVDEIDLRKADISDSIGDYLLYHAAFSEDERSVVFLMRARYNASSLVLVYDLDAGDFFYERVNIKIT
jgi:hypothetical protein